MPGFFWWLVFCKQLKINDKNFIPAPLTSPDVRLDEQVRVAHPENRTVAPSQKYCFDDVGRFPLRAARRFSRQNQRQEPYALMLHVRICAGAVANHRLYRDRLLLRIAIGAIAGRPASPHKGRRPAKLGARTGDGRSCRGGALCVVRLYCAAFKPAGRGFAPNMTSHALCVACWFLTRREALDEEARR